MTPDDLETAILRALMDWGIDSTAKIDRELAAKMLRASYAIGYGDALKAPEDEIDLQQAMVTAETMKLRLPVI